MKKPDILGNTAVLNNYNETGKKDNLEALEDMTHYFFGVFCPASI